MIDGRVAGTALTFVLCGCEFMQSQVDGPEICRPDWFVDETLVRGIDFVHHSGASGDYFLPEIMGGGVALLDVDGDDDLDAYFVQSGSLTGDNNELQNQLFVNDGTGRFTRSAGGVASQYHGYGMGVATGDYDNDGDMDVFVTNLGRNTLLRNDGAGTFTDVSARSGVTQSAWSTGAAYADLDDDGDQDLFVVNYVRWSKGVEHRCYHPWLGSRDYCSPTSYRAPTEDRVYQNQGDGTFLDVTHYAGMLQTYGNGLGTVVADFDRDGRMDVFVANDMSANHIWYNQGDFRFQNDAFARGIAVDEHGQLKAGMGVVAEDFNEDAQIDVLVVNLVGQSDTYFENEADHFTDQTSGMGLTNTSQRYTRFGLIASDFNHDGWLDLFQANGAILKSAETPYEDHYAEPNALYVGDGIGSMLSEPCSFGGGTSRGAAVGDIDNDGDDDIVIANRDSNARLLINQAPTAGEWIQFNVQAHSGANALGARVEIEFDERKLVRTVQTAGSYLAARSPILTVGLGKATTVDKVVVHWTDGSIDEYDQLGAGSRWLLQQGQSTATKIQF